MLLYTEKNTDRNARPINTQNHTNKTQCLIVKTTCIHFYTYIRGLKTNKYDNIQYQHSDIHITDEIFFNEMQPNQ